MGYLSFDMAKRMVLLLLLCPAACSNQVPYATTIGLLPADATMTVRVARANLSAFHPAAGEPRDRFTVSATAAKNASPPPAPRLRAGPHGVTVTAKDPLADLLIRVPDGVTLVVESRGGDVHVTDITGNARIAAASGNVQVMLPGYAAAKVGKGNLSVRMGATDWPGTLHFSTGRGDIEVWIRDTASFNVHLHTGNGMIFTDFSLRGTSHGGSETIDGKVNGGGPHGVDIESAAGAIRLLQLHPQP